MVLNGDWTIAAGVKARGSPASIVSLPAVGSISFDATALGHWDTALLLFLSELRQQSAPRQIGFDDSGLPMAAQQLLALLPAAEPAAAASPPPVGITERVGRRVIVGWNGCTAVLDLVGTVLISTAAAVRGRAYMRRSDLLDCLFDAGVSALPIVAIVNLLVGAILAFVGAAQLRAFGADIYVANLVGIGEVREMAPLMTALVLCGRAGGAYAAHIASMRGSEEIDALNVIGISIPDYLLLPRMLALTTMMPLLFLYGSVIGILGGLAVAVPMLGLSAEGFFNQIRDTLNGATVLFGLVKSVSFGGLIAFAGCGVGLRAGRSAADVGRATTSAVVVGIVGVIALDAMFAVCAEVIGI